LGSYEITYAIAFYYGLPLVIKMDPPVELKDEEVNNEVPIKSKPYPCNGKKVPSPTIFVLPRRQMSYLYVPWDEKKFKERLEWIHKINSIIDSEVEDYEWIKNNLELYFIGVRLSRINQTGSYLSFFKIVESFIEGKYRKEYIDSQDLLKFPNKELNGDIKAIVETHFNFDSNKQKREIDNLASQMTQKFKTTFEQIYCPHKDVLRYTCIRSGFYSKRDMNHYDEKFKSEKDFERYMEDKVGGVNGQKYLTIYHSSKLYTYRHKIAHYGDDKSGIRDKDKILSVCGGLAKQLLEKEISDVCQLTIR